MIFQPIVRKNALGYWEPKNNNAPNNPKIAPDAPPAAIDGLRAKLANPPTIPAIK